jgi:Domain of unknown function DUF29
MAEVAAVAKRVGRAASRKLYEADEHAWIERQIAALRDGDFDRVDRDSLIEFLTDMAGRDRRELESRLVVLYSHVLKYHLQQERATRSWRLTVLEQQRAIRRLFKHLPSLAKRADEILRDVYPDAVQAALLETGANRKAVPSKPEFDVAALLNFPVMPSGDGISIPPRP